VTTRGTILGDARRGPRDFGEKMEMRVQKSHGGIAPLIFPEVNRRKALSRARADSISRLWGTALVAREINSIRTAEATPSTARSKAGSLTFEGFVNPETFLTN